MDFLESFMLKMGLNKNMVALIMSCVHSRSLSIIINGEPKGLIHPSRGLRQGDLILPYLFLMCTDRLIALLQDVKQTRLINGV